MQIYIESTSMRHRYERAIDSLALSLETGDIPLLSDPYGYFLRMEMESQLEIFHSSEDAKPIRLEASRLLRLSIVKSLLLEKLFACGVPSLERVSDAIKFLISWARMVTLEIDLQLDRHAVPILRKRRPSRYPRHDRLVVMIPIVRLMSRERHSDHRLSKGLPVMHRPLRVPPPSTHPGKSTQVSRRGNFRRF